MIPIRSNWDTLRAKTYNRYVSSESVKIDLAPVACVDTDGYDEFRAT